MEWLPWILVVILGGVCALLAMRMRGQNGSAAAPDGAKPAKAGMPAGQTIQSVIERRAKSIQTKGGSFCLMSIGLDGFQALTDAFGGVEGERLMTQFAEHSGAVAGTGHDLVRVGPGELALLVSGGVNLGTPLANKLQKSLADIGASGPSDIRLTVSIGMAVYPEHGGEAVLYDHAQLAMRSVRGAGGDGVCIYDPQMSVAIREQAQMVNDLRMAVSRNELSLYFQPKIDAQSLQVTACEALLRWNHATRGFISPAVFIPLAEQHGLMDDLGRWVIDEACREAVKWRDKGLRMRVAVNISGAQMREEGLVDHILQALALHRLPPERFTCEITESVAMEDTQRTRQTFERMREARLHVSIDDFGTGYSSLAALRKLPAAELKVDRAFVSDVEHSEDARSIASSIVQMAKALNLRVVAEGVETAWQRDYLVKLGCSELQGYLFSMPVPSEELARMASAGVLNGAAGFRDSLFKPTDFQSL